MLSVKGAGKLYKPRTYRRWVKSDDLITFEVTEGETDLLILAAEDLRMKSREAVLFYRRDIEDYIKAAPDFFTSLGPVEAKRDAPRIVKAMIDASKKAGVGPMAAVAGAMAEFVGRELLKFSDEVIIENGGDIFMKTLKARRLGVYAGDKSPFTGRLALEIEPDGKGLGICTSSGTVSHSLSFGNADAALIISDNASLADAMATATGNVVKRAEDIEKGISFAKSVSGVRGVLIIVGDKLGSWGEIRLV